MTRSPKQKIISLRVSLEFLEVIRAKAQQWGLPYQTFLKLLVDQGLEHLDQHGSLTVQVRDRAVAQALLTAQKRAILDAKLGPPPTSPQHSPTKDVPNVDPEAKQEPLKYTRPVSLTQQERAKLSALEIRALEDAAHQNLVRTPEEPLREGACWACGGTGEVEDTFLDDVYYKDKTPCPACQTKKRPRTKERPADQDVHEALAEMEALFEGEATVHAVPVVEKTVPVPSPNVESNDDPELTELLALI